LRPLVLKNGGPGVRASVPKVVAAPERSPQIFARATRVHKTGRTDGFDQNLKNWWFCWFTKNQIVVFFLKFGKM
jgi:hypothetical protein